MARKMGVYLSPPLEAVLKNRENHDSLSGRLATVAQRYTAVMDDALPDLTEAEWNACRDALNGVWLRDRGAIGFIWAEIADADALSDKWDIDAQALAQRIREMSLAEKTALVEAVEQWWADQDEK